MALLKGTGKSLKKQLQKTAWSLYLIGNNNLAD